MARTLASHSLRRRWMGGSSHTSLRHCAWAAMHRFVPESNRFARSFQRSLACEHVAKTKPYCQASCAPVTHPGNRVQIRQKRKQFWTQFCLFWIWSLNFWFSNRPRNPRVRKPFVAIKFGDIFGGQFWHPNFGRVGVQKRGGAKFGHVFGDVFGSTFWHATCVCVCTIKLLCSS
jgi:hypothetical protein